MRFLGYYFMGREKRERVRGLESLLGLVGENGKRVEGGAPPIDDKDRLAHLVKPTFAGMEMPTWNAQSITIGNNLYFRRHAAYHPLMDRVIEDPKGEISKFFLNHYVAVHGDHEGYGITPKQLALAMLLKDDLLSKRCVKHVVDEMKRDETDSEYRHGGVITFDGRHSLMLHDVPTFNKLRMKVKKGEERPRKPYELPESYVMSPHVFTYEFNTNFYRRENGLLTVIGEKNTIDSMLCGAFDAEEKKWRDEVLFVVPGDRLSIRNPFLPGITSCESRSNVYGEANHLVITRLSSESFDVVYIGGRRTSETKVSMTLINIGKYNG